jgi:hypothetical protein
MQFPEIFLQYVWQFQAFEHANLVTTEGEPLEIIEIGQLNRGAGADFETAKIRIGELIWAGQVEIHTKASDWYKHQHQTNRAYDTVILHVVYEADEVVKNSENKALPTLVLKDRISPLLVQKYWKLLENKDWIPCQAHFGKVSEMTRLFWLERLAVERLEGRVLQIQQQLEAEQMNWEQVFYQSLAASLGAKSNKAPMLLLAQNTPLLLLARHKNNLFQIEALLFGQAGFLEGDFEEIYPQTLQKEYIHLKNKYQLHTQNTHSWKFGRMRPANFPTIRLAQLAQLIYQSTHLFSKILLCQSASTCATLFELSLHEYWKTHYQLDKISPEHPKTLGKETISLLIINTIVPYLFAYGKLRGETAYCEKALLWLDELEAEDNSIIEMWENMGIQVRTAAQSQALLQLKNEYCEAKRCLECNIGHQILGHL